MVELVRRSTLDTIPFTISVLIVDWYMRLHLHLARGTCGGSLSDYLWRTAATAANSHNSKLSCSGGVKPFRLSGRQMDLDEVFQRLSGTVLADEPHLSPLHLWKESYTAQGCRLQRRGALRASAPHPIGYIVSRSTFHQGVTNIPRTGVSCVLHALTA
jgi:hypothetical protein